MGRGLFLLFRLDCSSITGSGHLMRCLTLADAVARRGGCCVFAVCNLPKAFIPRVKRFGHRLIFLRPNKSEYSESSTRLAHAGWLSMSPEDDAAEVLQVVSKEGLLSSAPGCSKRLFDAVIVDHYALDCRWETPIRQIARCVIAIDDLADRVHDCDLLLDQNPGRDLGSYSELIPEGALCLAGPRFALLRSEFFNLRAESIECRKSAVQLHGLVSLGGVDVANLTGACLSALTTCSLPLGSRLTVILGAQCPHVEAIRAQAAAFPWPVEVVVDSNQMAKHMAAADWAVGAAGISALERCCMGLPSLTLIVADNQISGARVLERSETAVVLPYPILAHELSDVFRDGMRRLFEHASLLSERSASLCDGLGTERVVKEIEKLVRTTP